MKKGPWECVLPNPVPHVLSISPLALLVADTATAVLAEASTQSKWVVNHTDLTVQFSASPSQDP